MRTSKIKDLIDIFETTPQKRLFAIAPFDDIIQDDDALVETWDTIFDKLPIEIDDTIINDTDIDERIPNAVEAQAEFYHTTGLCYATSRVYDGNVLPLTYHEMTKLITRLYYDMVTTQA